MAVTKVVATVAAVKEEAREAEVTEARAAVAREEGMGAVVSEGGGDGGGGTPGERAGE